MTTRAPFWTMGVAAMAATASCVASSAPLAAARPASAKPASVGRALGNFTPASADPRLAMAFSRSTTMTSGFRFTPASAAKTNRKVTVAVRARTTQSQLRTDRPASAGPLATIAPLAYNLGVSVGWRRFAVSGDMGQADLGLAGGRRQAADLGLSYTAKRWSTRLQLAAERPVGTAPRIVDSSESVALDVGGSYRLTRNIDVTAGVRYKSQRERLEPLKDNRRDSQAVYLGTAFRF
ncbi:MAG: porin [Chakrabartia sp.]